MRKFFSYCLLAVTMLLVASCKKESENPSLAQVIPSNASMVAKVQPERLLDNTGITLDELFGIAGIDESQVKSFGIDLDNPTYLFHSEDIPYAVVVPLTNGNNLKTVLSASRSVDVSSKDGFDWFTNDEMIACFDSKRLILTTVEVSRKDIVKLMKQNKDRSILGTALWEKLGEQNAAVSAVLTGRVAEEQNDMVNLALPKGVKARDIAVVMNLQNTPERLLLTIDGEGLTSDAQAYIDDFTSMIHPVQGKFLSYGLQNPLMWMGFHLKGSEMLESLSQNTQTKAMLDMAAMNGLDVKSLVSAFDGEISMQVGGDGQNVAFLMLAEVNDSQMADKLNALMAETGQNEVKFGMASDNVLCVTFKGNPLLGTTTGMESLKQSIAGKFGMYGFIDMATLISMAAKNNVPPVLMPILANMNKVNIEVSANSSHAEIYVDGKDGKTPFKLR